MPMVLVTGARGQLGQEVVDELLRQDYKVIAAGHEELDITNEFCVRGAIVDTKVDAVINCAAYTAVDKAEDEEKAAYDLNALGPKYLAQACKEADIPLIHVSTDYVLDTITGRPHFDNETPNAESVYGRTKLAGENFILKSGCRALIVRVSWLFGPRGKNFVKTMLRLGRSRDTLTVVCDEIGGPTPAAAFGRDLVNMTYQALDPNFRSYGVYHYCGHGYCSWAQFARAIFEKAKELKLIDHEVKVLDITAKEYGARAKRPRDSRLDTNRTAMTFGLEMPKWADYIADTLLAE